jgi:hypothetical protein
MSHEGDNEWNIMVKFASSCISILELFHTAHVVFINPLLILYYKWPTSPGRNTRQVEARVLLHYGFT